MVDSILSLSTRGLRDWLIQRVTALIIGLYAIFIIGFIILHPQMQFDEWQSLFSFNITKIFSLLVLFSIILHAWIGMWTVFTDYITSWRWRLFLEILVAILFFGLLAWGAVVLWGF
ncbi:MAG: succinate dehydrogenase, hydrophobic membrane anchor protein [Gammaproteobacteria bacterium]|nr:succinate dehydrogenase, hydrophobic membrane anchor protein [Gammaproteobacteria bacterium]